jgi:hypothetical protein
MLTAINNLAVNGVLCFLHLTADEYLEDTLKSLPLEGADIRGIREKNGMRNVIKDVFPTLSCRWLPHPGCNTKNLSSLPDSNLDPAFVKVFTPCSELSLLLEESCGQLQHRRAAGLLAAAQCKLQHRSTADVKFT